MNKDILVYRIFYTSKQIQENELYQEVYNRILNSSSTFNIANKIYQNILNLNLNIKNPYMYFLYEAMTEENPIIDFFEIMKDILDLTDENDIISFLLNTYTGTIIGIKPTYNFFNEFLKMKIHDNSNSTVNDVLSSLMYLSSEYVISSNVLDLNFNKLKIKPSIGYDENTCFITEAEAYNKYKAIVKQYTYTGDIDEDSIFYKLKRSILLEDDFFPPKISLFYTRQIISSFDSSYDFLLRRCYLSRKNQTILDEDFYKIDKHNLLDLDFIKNEIKDIISSQSVLSFDSSFRSTLLSYLSSKYSSINNYNSFVKAIKAHNLCRFLQGYNSSIKTTIDSFITQYIKFKNFVVDLASFFEDSNFKDFRFSII